MNVELEVTLRCNRACPQCNRYCDWMSMPDSDMTLTQIERFCNQVEASGRKLGVIRILGGEPLLHPELEAILHILHSRLVVHRRLVSRLEMTTNGDLLPKVHPRVLEYAKLRVDWSKRGFAYAMAAPKDLGQARRQCTVPRHCGIALNCWGYWPCGPGSAIARLFHMPHFQRFDLPESFESFGKADPLGNIPEMCDLCQWSAKRPVTIAELREPTESYRIALAAFHGDISLEKF